MKKQSRESTTGPAPGKLSVALSHDSCAGTG